MTTPANKDISSWYAQGSSPLKDGSYPSSARASGSSGTLKAYDLSLASAGRFSFWLDYSERTTAGDHTFYVQRTHGSTGAVGVTWTASGDGSPTDTGELAWADGELDIKSVTVNVASKPSNGLHVIQVVLSSPTGGAVLHNGTNTIAYGIIDDSTVPDDSDAVFYDSAAGGGGTGTAASPYNNIYTAIAAVASGGAGSSKRYLCGKGTTTPDGTNTCIPNGGGGTVNCIFIPDGRSSEATRLFVMAWPGFTWTVSGGASTTTTGFYCDGGTQSLGTSNYITFRGIDFSSLDTSGATFAEAGGINYFGSGGDQINVEYCTGDDINGSTNTSLFNFYASDGGRMWRCTANNIQFNGSNTNPNAGGLSLYYNTTNLSVQRCEATNAGGGVYAKGLSLANNIGMKVMFCDIDCSVGLHYGFGNSAHETNYTITSHNLIKNANLYQAMYFTGADPNGNDGQWIANNVFDNCGAGDNGAVFLWDTYDAICFNNVFYNCRRAFDGYDTIANQSNAGKDTVKYMDYNIVYAPTLNAYRYRGVAYTASSNLNAAFSSIAGNDSASDPSFTNTATNDYTRTGTPTDGVDGTEAGIYLTGSEVVGA